MMSLPGMRDRSILVNSMSKTYSVTGWRVGWVLAAPDLTDSIRKVHDFLTVGAASPLQQAGVLALSLPEDYYADLAQTYSDKRDTIVRILTERRVPLFPPARSLLCHDGYLRFRFRERYAIRVVHGGEDWCGGGSGIEFLSQFRVRKPTNSLLFL